MGWQEPKTDWTADDLMNYQDYNRIKGNLEYLWEEACELYGKFPLTDMGPDISETDPWRVRYFNAIESNVDEINRHIFTQDYGIRQTFYENGPFMRYSELKRIEGAILGMKQMIDGAKAGRRRLAFRLGAPKGFKA